jgi:sarcosine oxidase gamma subunit
MRFAWVLLLAFSALAQTPPVAPPTTTISGTVRDASTGAPITEASVTLTGSSSQLRAMVDSEGRYTLSGVQPGYYSISASVGFGPYHYQDKTVTVSAGQSRIPVDFKLQAQGQISGKVLDENKEPVPGVQVVLVAREYRSGALRYVFASPGRTNDQGEYTVTRVAPGRAYLLLAQKYESKLDAVSNAPAKAELRKRATASTYYPDSATREGAEAITLRPGELREGVDFRLRRTPSYCLEGVLEGPGGPAALGFTVEDQTAGSGASGNGALYRSSPGGKTGPDGKIRLCDLYPGEFKITVSSDTSFGTVTVAITDRDVANLHIPATPRVAVPGEVLLDGPAPEKPTDARLTFSLRPTTRPPSRDEVLSVSAVSIPGEFAFPSLSIDDYDLLMVRGVPSGWYIKDITYGGRSILNRLFHPGSAIGNAALRVTVARDGGFVRATVADKDGKPVPDCYVILMPEHWASEADLAARIVSGWAGKDGVYASPTLAPGKYLALVSETGNDNTPESIARFASLRLKAKEVDVAPGRTVEVRLEQE